MAALSTLRSRGVQVAEITLPLSFVDFQKLNGDIVAFEAYRHLAALVDDLATAVDAHIRRRVLAGRAISPESHAENLARLAGLRGSFRDVLGPGDILALPGTPTCALPLSEVDETQIPMSRYTRVANCLDLCAISLPLPRPARSLPVGLQLRASAGSDGHLLAVAEAIATALGPSGT